MREVPDYLAMARRAAQRTHCARSAISAVSHIHPKPNDGVLKEALTVDEARAEMRRTNSGPAKALATYLAKSNTERLQWLTKATLRARGMDAGDWRRHVSAVKEAALPRQESTETTGEERR